MIRYLPLMIKNGLRNKRRSVLTISSVAASMCLLGVLFALYQALFNAPPPTGQALRLITYHKVSLAQFIPASYEARIRAVPGVKDVMIWQWFGGTYKDARDRRNFFARFSIEPDKLFAMRTELLIPEEEKKAFLASRTGAVASRALADKFGWKTGEKITLVGDIFPVNLELKILGIFEDPDKSETLFFNHEYLRQSLPLADQDKVGSYSVVAESPEAASRIGPVIDRLFENAPEPTKTESEASFGLQFLSFLGNVKMFLIAICAAVTFTILLVSANTMAMSVRERMREVGILKTLGYTNGAVLSIILGEAGFISLLGAIAGLGLASIITSGARNNAAGFQQLKFLTISPVLGAECVAFAMVIGIASAFWPAWTASRTGILDSLRDVG